MRLRRGLPHDTELRGPIKPETCAASHPKESAMTALVIILTLNAIVYACNAYQVLSMPVPGVTP
jgi:hypothetical protein